MAVELLIITVGKPFCPVLLAEVDKSATVSLWMCTSEKADTAE